MNKNIFLFCILVFVFFCNTSFAGICYFEEVYKNGEVQEGIFLNSDQKIRYEYFDENLYTIIFNNEKLLVIQNNDKENFHEILDKQKLFMFKSLLDLVVNYPNIENKITKDSLTIDIEGSALQNFPKRVGVKSNQINLSIYLKDCISRPVNDLFFKYNPLFDYPR